jgi:HlyD family secretion protein
MAWFALAILLFLAAGSDPRTRSAMDTSRIGSARARRMELRVTIRAAGQVESAVQTLIRCEVENIKGKGGFRAGATAILSLVEEGTRVHSGDVLCRLDQSEYEELTRLQQIAVAQVRAQHRAAVLDHDRADIALRQYLDGLRLVQTTGFREKITLATSEVARRADRLEWSRRMLAKGYVSRAHVASQAAALEQAEFDLARIRSAFRQFRDFEVVGTTRSLQSELESAKVTLTFRTLRLRAEESRLARFEQQIARCTIRAPHNGQVILAHKPKRGLRIEEGLSVRQKQALMYLPDTSRLEIHVWLNETVVDKVRPGMRARVRPEGSGHWFGGEVITIEPLPVTDRNDGVGPEVKCYLAHVRLADLPSSLRLGLTAEVVIELAVLHNALVVPAQAVRHKDGRYICRVLSRDGLEPRTVLLGQSTPEWQEIAGGLEEGEAVALSRGPFPALTQDGTLLGHDAENTEFRGL